MLSKSIFLTLVLGLLLITIGCGGKVAGIDNGDAEESAAPAQFAITDGRNDSVYASLAVAGVENALVDLTGERTIIGYELPGDLDKEVALFYILGAAARHTNPEATITTTLFTGGQPSEEATVAAKDVIAFLNEEISLQECQARISRTTPSLRRHNGPASSMGVLAAPLLPAVNAQEDIEPAQAARCMRMLKEWQDQCNSAYFKELNTGPGYDFEKIKADCLLLAKKAFLRCIGRPKNSIYWDADKVEDEYNLWIKLVRPRRAGYVAPALGKIGETIMAGVQSGPVSLGGSPGSKVVGTLVGLGGNKVMEKVTEPLSEDAEKKKEAQEEIAKSIESKLEEITLPVDDVVLENFFFVVIDPEDANPSEIGDRPHTNYMAEYKPERYSETWQVYFPLTPVVQAEAYLKVRAFDGPDRNVMGMGFGQAGLFSGDATRPHQVWNQPATENQLPRAAAGGNTAPETSVQQYVIEFPPDPLPTAEIVIEGPGGFKGIAMPGGRNNPIIPPERSVERVELDTRLNWLYVAAIEPPVDPWNATWCVENTGTSESLKNDISQMSCATRYLPTDSEEYVVVAQDTQIHYMEFRHSPGDPTRYVITLTGTANDHGSGPDDATPLAVGKPVIGQLRTRGFDRDWFSIELNSGEWLAISLDIRALDERRAAHDATLPPLDLIDLLLPDGTSTWNREDHGISTLGDDTVLWYNVKVSGRYTLQVRGGSGAYKLTVTKHSKLGG